MSVYVVESGAVQQLVCSECCETVNVVPDNDWLQFALNVFTDAHLGCRQFSRVLGSEPNPDAEHA